MAQTRVTCNLFVSSIDLESADRIRSAAGARRMSIGQYVARLQALHDAARARADTDDEGLQAELIALGLETVVA